MSGCNCEPERISHVTRKGDNKNSHVEIAEFTVLSYIVQSLCLWGLGVPSFNKKKCFYKVSE